MSLFYDVAAALTEPNLDRALERTLVLVAEHMRLDAAWVWLLDEVTSQFYLAAAYDLPPYLREPLHMTGEPCWCMRAFFDREFVAGNVDIIACSRLQEGIEAVGEGATRGLRAHASISLRFGDRALGLLNAARAHDPSLTRPELETLATIGAQVGVAVERSRLAERAASAARLEERASLARELHDTILQDLTAISLHLESAERKTITEPAVAEQRIATAIGLTRSTLDDLRRSVDGLRNDPLHGETLATALSRLARKFTSETGVQVGLAIAPGESGVGVATEFAVYRIVSEALTNVRRHSGARRVAVQLERNSEHLILRVQDDGCGFAPMESTEGFGLLGMRERAEELGGTFAVSSSDAGTVLDVVLPVVAA